MQPSTTSTPLSSSTLAPELTTVLDSSSEHAIIDLNLAAIIDLKHNAIVVDLKPTIDTSFVSLVLLHSSSSTKERRETKK
jgi:hypothetical protein